MKKIKKFENFTNESKSELTVDNIQSMNMDELKRINISYLDDDKLWKAFKKRSSELSPSKEEILKMGIKDIKKLDAFYLSPDAFNALEKRVEELGVSSEYWNGQL